MSSYRVWLLLMATAYLTADVLILSVRPLFLSTSHKLSAQQVRQSRKKRDMISEYRPISDFNVFHNAPIPPSLSSVKKTSSFSENVSDGKPSLSRLPLKLNGTIVYQNELFSLASITRTGSGVSDSYQIGDSIANLARLTQIETERVYFINLTTNREEYLQISDLSKVTGLKFKNPVTKRVFRKKELKAKNFNFKINRSTINRYFRRLPDVLQQASVVPYWKDGELIGHQFKYIEPGSVYETKLGFKVSDIIVSVDGEKVRSPLHAAELFHRVKNNSKVNMLVKREGRDLPFSWSINEDSSIEQPGQLQ